MEKAVLKLTREDIERKYARELFSTYFMAFDKVYRQMAAEYYGVFRDAFYNVPNGIKLCEMKGLGERVRRKGKRVKVSVYLDYITTDELNALTDALKVLPSIVEQGEEKGEEVPYIKAKIREYGVECRRKFEMDHMCPPEFMPPEGRSSLSIKRSYKKFNAEKMTFTSAPKEAVKENVATVKENTTIGNKPTYRQTKLFEDDRTM